MNAFREYYFSKGYFEVSFFVKELHDITVASY